MPAKLESLGPRSAEGPLRTAVAKAIILPLWGLRGRDQLESFGFWGRKFCIKNVEILSVGKIAEFAKFAGGERRKSPDLISLYERSDLLGRGPIESLRALGADADKDINLSVSVRRGLDGRVLSLTLKRLRRLLWLS